MNKNFSNRVVYLTEAGAKRLFANSSCKGLKFIPCGPILHEDGIITYLDAYGAISGHRIGGIIGGDAFTDEEPQSKSIIEAEEAYEYHCNYLDSRFGPQEREAVDVAEILAKEQEEPVPFAYIGGYLNSRRKK